MSRRLPSLASIICLLAASFLALPPAQATPDMDQSLVSVRITYQTFDPFLPWLRNQTASRFGYGVAVENGLILTTEALVRNATLVEIAKTASGRLIPCHVTIADDLCNLALLQPANETPLAPLRLASTVDIDESVDVVQFDETGKIAFSKATVDSVALAPLPSAPSQSLTFSILCQANVNAQGAAVLRGSRLLGIVHSYESASRTADVLPFPALQAFLEDAATPPYNGQASAGFVWTALIDPVKRAYLKAPQAEVGVQVLRCLPGSGASAVLQQDDIVTQWNGYNIDSLGFYNDKQFGRIAMPYLINGRGRPGDSVPVTLWRNGTQLQVNVTLSRRLDRDQFIPENTAGDQAEYLVEAGCVLRELTGDYLRAYGPKWQQAVDAKLAYLYQTARNSTEQSGDRLLLLSRVLPDPINIGYHNIRDARVTAINNKPVRNLHDAFAIADTDGAISRITLEGVGVDIVLDTRQIARANQRISERYRIPALRFRRN